MQHQNQAASRIAVTAPAPETAPPAPADAAPTGAKIVFPIEAVGEPEKASLPPLSSSDNYLAGAIGLLMARRDSLTFMHLDGFARRVVATVDNLARAHAAPRLCPVNQTPGRFSTTEAGTTASTIALQNHSRYVPLVHLIESIDTSKAVAVYASAYPLFQQAYDELGYPGRYFNDRLVAVIDHLLATPTRREALAVKLTEIKGPMAPQRPWVRYEFADPALESLSSGQKMLLRAGPDNQARLKLKLQELRGRLTAAAITQPGSTARR